MPLTEEEKKELQEIETELSQLESKPTGFNYDTVKKFLPPNLQPEYLKGVIRGATFGAYPPKEELSGSIFQPTSEKFSSKLGEFTGMTIPLALSAELGGAPLAGLVGSRGGGLLAQNVAKGLGTGMVYGAGEEISNKGIGTPIDVLRRGAETGVTFGALGLGGSLLGKLRNLFGNKIPETAYEKILETSKTKNMADLQGIGETLGSRAAKMEGFYGTKDTMLDKTVSGIKEMENQLQKELIDISEEEVAAKYSVVTRDRIIKSIKSLKSNYKNIPSEIGDTAVKQIDKAVERISKYPQKLNVVQANKIVRDIDKVINDRAFLKQISDNPISTQILRTTRTSIRNQMKNSSPEIRNILAQESLFIGLRNSLQDSLAKDVGSFTGKFIEPTMEAMSTSGSRLLNRGLGTPSNFIAPIVGGLAKRTAVSTEFRPPYFQRRKTDNNE